ncbi:MAG TPA: hypothetical protein VGC87_09730 [Pyrinomonadaceae bacterium]
MTKQPVKRKSKRRRQPKRSRYTTAEAAALAVAILVAGTDKSSIERLIKLALRAPDELIRNLTAFLLAQHGENIEAWLSNEPTTPASKEELVEITKPVLKIATNYISMAQLLDIYLIGKAQSPDDVLFAFYIGARMLISQERTPSKEESRRIWELTVDITRRSKIGGRHLQELEQRGQVYLDSWLEEVKEKARKKFLTFVRQKKQTEENANKSFNWLLSFLFDADENAQNPT